MCDPTYSAGFGVGGDKAGRNDGSYFLRRPQSLNLSQCGRLNLSQMQLDCETAHVETDRTLARGNPEPLGNGGFGGVSVLVDRLE